MEDADIIKRLKSEGDDRGTAMTELFGGDSSAVLVRLRGNKLMVTSRGEDSLAATFTALVAAAQQVGSAMGLDLQWVKKPDSIVVPGPGNGPRLS